MLSVAIAGDVGNALIFEYAYWCMGTYGHGLADIANGVLLRDFIGGFVALVDIPSHGSVVGKKHFG
jgi:hypothetical protein